jgi:hypothetical protein
MGISCLSVEVGAVEVVAHAAAIQPEHHDERRHMGAQMIAMMKVMIVIVVVMMMVVVMMVVVMMVAAMAMAAMTAAVFLRLAFVQLKRLAHTDVVFAHV